MNMNNCVQVLNDENNSRETATIHPETSILIIGDPEKVKKAERLIKEFIARN